MQLQIPFTDIKVFIGQDPKTSKSRGYAKGKYSADPEHDVRGYKCDPRSLYTAWRNSTDIYGCVREIYQGVASGGHHFFDPSDDKKERPASPANVKRVTDVMEYQYGSIRAFKRKVFQALLIAGNTYGEKVKNALNGEMIGVKVLDPRTLAIVSDEHGNIFRYIQTMSDENGWTVVDPVVFEPDEIFHWMDEQDPNAEVFGMSPLEHAIWEARTDLAAMTSNYAFFENDATPSTWYILEENLGDEQAKQATDWIKEQFKGPKNRHKATTLRYVKDVKQLRLSNAEMEFLEGRHFTTEKICAAYGVPKVLLGYTDGVNFTNHEGQRKEFHDGTVADYDDVWNAMVNDIIKELGLEKQVGYMAKPPVFDSDEVLYNRAINARKAGLLTINGAKRMIGQDPVDTAIEGDMGDRTILGDGSAAVLLTDIGVQPQQDPNAQLDQVKNIVEQYAKDHVREAE